MIEINGTIFSNFLKAELFFVYISASFVNRSLTPSIAECQLLSATSLSEFNSSLRNELKH
jgi:hypothetical protein